MKHKIYLLYILLDTESYSYPIERKAKGCGFYSITYSHQKIFTSSTVCGTLYTRVYCLTKISEIARRGISCRPK